MADERPTPPLPCPECRTAGKTGGQRIGNNRSVCVTCNRFAQNVRRQTLNRLKARHPDDYEEIRTIVEMDLYPQVLEEFISRSPSAWRESDG